MNINLILEKVKLMLDMVDTTMYDDKLKSLYIPSAIAKLKGEGIDYIDEKDEDFQTYVICIGCQCAFLLDFNNASNEHLLRMYITNVNELRTKRIK